MGHSYNDQWIMVPPSSSVLWFWTHFLQDTCRVDYIRPHKLVLVLYMVRSWYSWAVGPKKQGQRTGTFQVVPTVQPSKLIIEESLPNAVDMCAVWQGFCNIQPFQESNSVRKLPAVEVVGLSWATAMSWQSIWGQKNQILMKGGFVHARDQYFS